MLVISSPSPWALDGDPPATQGHFAIGMTVAHRGALRVIGVLGADDLIQLGLHHLAEHAQPDTDADLGGGDAFPGGVCQAACSWGGLRLKRLAKRAKHAFTRERAAILLGSNAGLSAPSIAASWLTDDNHVRKVIYEFNERGFSSLDPDYRGGYPRRIEREDHQRIAAIAGARPDTQGPPL